MAVAAIDPDPSDVVLVTEGHRLVLGDVYSGGERRASEQAGPPSHQCDGDYRTHDTEPRERIRTRVKNLGH
jgi:hypothetical protein